MRSVATALLSLLLMATQAALGQDLRRDRLADFARIDA
jgi:hypothetical protein